jgi:hypothetical protein
MQTMLRVVTFFLVLASQGAFAETYTGRLINGGGLEDMSLTIKTDDGKSVEGYCTATCGQLAFKEGKDGVSSLEKRFINKRVRVTIVKRKNTGIAVAGPAEDEVLPFVTQLTFLK